VYLALVRGVPEPRRGTWHDWVLWDDKGLALRPAALQRDAVEAILNYEVREAFRDAALVQVTLVTGRQNQIRAQAMFHGHPLLGEQKYGIDGEDAGVGDGASAVDRQALHAHRLGFAHPVTGLPVHFESPLPKDLNRLLARLRDAKR
jgi:23S rRNA pseudouridine1911/1915/1917 synthase